MLHLLRLERDPHIAPERLGPDTNLLIRGGEIGVDARQPRVRGCQRKPSTSRLARRPTGRE